MKCQTTPDIILVSCGAMQLPRPGVAKAHYRSPLFKKARAYAESKDALWFILSTKYGLLDPESHIAPYNKEQPDDGWDQWQQDILAALVRSVGNLSGVVIEVHAGKKYVKYGLEAGLLAAGARVTKPLQGLRHGERLSWYKQHGY